MSETTKSGLEQHGRASFRVVCGRFCQLVWAAWRFPYLAAKYGGGTFLLMYFVFVFTIGLALLLLEIVAWPKDGPELYRSI